MAAVLASFEGSSDDGIFTADAIYTWFRSAHSERNLSFKLDDLKRAFYDLASAVGILWTIWQARMRLFGKGRYSATHQCKRRNEQIEGYSLPY